MKDIHIISILESSPFDSLSESELATVRAHVVDCEECRRAYQAARISSSLVKERVAAVVEPPPFFETRVMAALRERQASSETVASSLRRLWRATGALVTGMTATVAALAVFTFFAPQLESTPQGATPAFDAYSAEEVILARGDQPGDDLSYDQVLATIYEAGDDSER